MPDFQAILSMPEGKTLEFKRDLSSLLPIIKTIISFANTAGGFLIIGKDDEGDVIGIKDIFEAEERLANAIADSIFPRLIPDIEAISVDGKSLLVIGVTHWPGPFYLKSKGPKEGTFIRIGSTNRVAGEEWLNALNQVKSNISFDQKPCLEAEVDDLDRDLMDRLFNEVGKKIDQSKLISLGVIDKTSFGSAKRSDLRCFWTSFWNNRKKTFCRSYQAS